VDEKKRKKERTEGDEHNERERRGEKNSGPTNQ